MPDETEKRSVPVDTEISYIVPPRFTPLPLGQIRPLGWLRDWCVTAAGGITGHSDELDPLFAKGWVDSNALAVGTGAQTGDKMVGYAHEQAGYWIDGAVRLAHLLEDGALLKKCDVRFEALLARVNAGESPVRGKDAAGGDLWASGDKWGHWPMAVMGRAMLAEFSFTGDEQYLRALERIYADYPRYNAQKKFSLIHHQGRQLANVEVMLEAYRLGGDRRLKEDAIILLRQQTEEITRRLSWHQGGIQTGKTNVAFNSVPFGHAVTLNESAKIPAIGYLFTGEQKWLEFSEAYFADMEQNEMMPIGLTSSHEHIGGIGPFSTSELCNAIDYTWSAIWMLRITGNGTYGDYVERAMFNAAPSGISPDFKSHQYFLSSNRIDATHPGGTNVGAVNVGGKTSFEPKQFPLCCTGNMSRLIPDYVMHLWMKSADGGIAVTLYGPSEVKTTIGRVDVSLTMQTDFPFGLEADIHVKPASAVKFPLYLRAPAWCAEMKVQIDGINQPLRVENGFVRIERTWQAGEVVHVSFPADPHVQVGKCADGAPFASVVCGPLVYALAIPTLDGDLNRPQPGVKWEYALSSKCQMKATKRAMPQPWTWQIAPVAVEVDAQPAAFQTNCTLPAKAVPASGQAEKLTLVPIGSTAFRVSMFAVVEEKR